VSEGIQPKSCLQDPQYMLSNLRHLDGSKMEEKWTGNSAHSRAMVLNVKFHRVAVQIVWYQRGECTYT